MISLADAAITVAKVTIDAAPARNMVAVVGASEGGARRDSELSLNGIEPRRFGRRPHGMDVQAAEQSQEARMIVDIVQIIQDDEEALARVASPQPAKGLAHLDDPFAPPEQAAQAVGMDVVEPEELLGAFAALIRRPDALRPPPPSPGDASQRLEFQRPPFVEADYRRARRARTVELPDVFFFRSKAGSVEVFHVRMRWARSPSRRRSRRTHSSVMGGSSPRCRQ